MNSKSFTTSNDGSDLANYGMVCEGESPTKTALQAVRFFATSADSSGSAVIELALVQGGACIARFRGTSTITARVVHADGSTTSSGYVCDVVWAESGNSKFDLLGMTNAPGGGAGYGGTAAGAAQGYQWLIGLVSFTTANDMILYWQPTSVV